MRINPRRPSRLRQFVALPLVVLLAGCGGGSDEVTVVRLVDEFAAATLSGSPQDAPSVLPTEWLLADSENGWKAGAGIADLGPGESGLRGRSTTDFPMMHVERTEGLGDQDVLERVVVRARVSAGESLSLNFVSREQLDVAALVERAAGFGWPLQTPLVVGDEFRLARACRSRRGRG